MKIYDVIIVGSGPAGYTAAIYTSRAFMSTLLLTGKEIGGQLTTTTLVENYPAFENGVLGQELMDAMLKQVKRFGTDVVAEEATGIDVTKHPFSAATPVTTYQGRTVIVATGASAKYLGLPSEERLRGKGVSACATCDGFFFKDKDVVVIGGGDTAMEEATFLTRFASKVTIIHRRDEFRSSAVMLKRARDNQKIRFLTNRTVTEILGEKSVSGVRLQDVKTGTVSTFQTQGVFLAIGHNPNTGFLKDVLTLDEKGYVIIKNSKSKVQSSGNLMLEAQTETSVPGIFAAGDCVDPRYRQAVVAAGMGCMAALDAQHYLEERGQ